MQVPPALKLEKNGALDLGDLAKQQNAKIDTKINEWKMNEFWSSNFLHEYRM